MTSADEQYRSGLGLLANAPTAADWRGGIELVDSAADAGLADAIERRALFECMGVGRPRDWQKAIDSLALAAERGCASAASQIILLAESGVDTAGDSVAEPDHGSEQQDGKRQLKSINHESTP